MICGGTAVFVCLVCGGAESSNDRFTLRFHAQEVIDFLNNCGNQNLQYLLVPSRLEAALLVLDTDRDGHIDEEEWCVSEPATLGRLRRGDGVLVA